MYEKQSRNTNRSTDTIASFLLKTYEILEHPEYQRIISWDKSNVGFIIHDVVLFTREILPKYFRHSNFSSFVRQLNMYDFHKVKQQNDILVFKNPLFCKGEQQNLKFIRRKAAKKISGQKRSHSYQKSDIENEKYENMLKGFKKSLETEINQSSLFYEKSLQVIKQLNESNMRKQVYLKDIFVDEEKIDTSEELKQGQGENRGKQEKAIKDTVIQIPKQFLSLEKQPKESVQQMQKKGRELNLDSVISLKEEVYQSLGNYQLWLQQYIDTQRKKIKYINGYRQQLIKCRQTKPVSNVSAYPDQQAKPQLQNSQKLSQPIEESIKLNKLQSDNLAANVKKVSTHELMTNKKPELINPAQIHRNIEQNILSIFQQSPGFISSLSGQKEYSSIKRQELRNQIFSPIIKPQFGSRLFSAFSKSKSFEDSHQDSNDLKQDSQQQFINKQTIEKVSQFQAQQNDQV